MNRFANLTINYENGMGTSIRCFASRDAYRMASRIVRGWDHVRSVELETGMTKLKMYAREYAGGRYMVLSRGDGSTVSAWVLNGNREGRDKGDY
jgi:hypothetical protein